MPTFDWAALVLFLAALLGGSVWAGVHGLRAWRNTRPAVRRLALGAEALSVQTAALEAHVAATERRSGELQEAVAGLSVSLARARVLADAAQEPKRLVDRVRSFIPRK